MTWRVQSWATGLEGMAGWNNTWPGQGRDRVDPEGSRGAGRPRAYNMASAGVGWLCVAGPGPRDPAGGLRVAGRTSAPVHCQRSLRTAAAGRRRIPDSLQWLPAEFCEVTTDLPEDECSLEQLLATGSGAAFYEYDSGDSWLHRLELVTRRPLEEADPPVQLLAGPAPWTARAHARVRPFSCNEAAGGG